MSTKNLGKIKTIKNETKLNTYFNFLSKNFFFKLKKQKENEKLKINHLKIEILEKESYISENIYDVLPNLESLLDLKEDKKLFEKINESKFKSLNYLRKKQKLKKNKINQTILNRNFSSKKMTLALTKSNKRVHSIQYSEIKNKNMVNFSNIIKNSEKFANNFNNLFDKSNYKTLKTKKAIGNFKKSTLKTLNYKNAQNMINSQFENYQLIDFDNYEQYKNIKV